MLLSYQLGCTLEHLQKDKWGNGKEGKKKHDSEVYSSSIYPFILLTVYPFLLLAHFNGEKLAGVMILLY
jgi:hypothetical protein